jgi:hypothetical protein
LDCCAQEAAQREEIEGFNGASRQKGTADYFAVLSSGKKSDELTEKEKEVPQIVFFHTSLAHIKYNVAKSSV